MHVVDRRAFDAIFDGVQKFLGQTPRRFFWSNTRHGRSHTVAPTWVVDGRGSRMTEAWKQWEGQAVNGEFQLRQYLGGSDRSAVFLTEYGEQEPQRAAIKLIPADPENAQLQLSRWGLAAKLSHPHLIRLFQMGRCQLGNVGLLFVVMEYAEENLSQILPHRPLTPVEAQDMLPPVLDVLAYVHGKGFVHGHMKPANIMAVDDQLKISSDGLCGVGESSGGLGKPSVYDPPETTCGRISPAADTWSLGMTVVEVLTQRLPVWEQPKQAEPALPETLPAPFFEIARHCLCRDPQHRWTVADITARLQTTPPVPNKQVTTRPPKRLAKWRYVVLSAAAGLALAAMLVAPRLLKRHQAHRAPSSAFEHSRVQQEPVPGPGTPETGQPDAAAKTPTGGLVRGAVVHQVLPDVPQRARDTIRGTVRVGVRVAVDPSGDVVGASFDSPGPSKYFADLALQAARRWKFDPAKVDGRNASSEWTLRFEFGRTATEVFPVQAAP
jgi:TonB family protein